MKTIPLSCADFTFPLLPHEAALALIRILGLSGVDLGIFSGRSHLQPEDILSGGPAAHRRMKDLLARHDLVASDVFLQTGSEPSRRAANDSDPVVRADNRRVFRAIIEFALFIGARHLTGLPGVRQPGVAVEVDWDLAVEEAQWRKAEAARAGLEYAVEAHVNSLLPDPQSALRFVQQSGVTLTLDYGHFVYQGMAPAVADILLPHASHFHARGGAHAQLQSTMKENTINFPAIRDALAARGYDGWMCLEYVWVDWEGCNRTDNISETSILRDLLRNTSTNPSTSSA